MSSPDASSDEPLSVNDWSPLEVYVGAARPKRVLLFTKPFLVRKLLETGRLPSGLAVLVRYGLPSKMVIAEVRAMLRRWRVPATFIGDLDPLDLAVFAAWRRGGSGVGNQRDIGLPIRYGGIDDRWLGLCEGHFSRGWSSDHVLIKMSKTELRQLQRLKRTEKELGGIDKLVGTRAEFILRSGHKLEIEGASNSAFYDKRFPAALRTHLREISRGGRLP